MVIANDHCLSIGIVCFVSNQGTFNVSRVSGRSAWIFLQCRCLPGSSGRWEAVGVPRRRRRAVDSRSWRRRRASSAASSCSDWFCRPMTRTSTRRRRPECRPEVSQSTSDWSALRSPPHLRLSTNKFYGYVTWSKMADRKKKWSRTGRLSLLSTNNCIGKEGSCDVTMHLYRSLSGLWRCIDSWAEGGSQDKITLLLFYGFYKCRFSAWLSCLTVWFYCVLFLLYLANKWMNEWRRRSSFNACNSTNGFIPSYIPTSIQGQATRWWWWWWWCSVNYLHPSHRGPAVSQSATVCHP